MSERVVSDASAMLALIGAELGKDEVTAVLPGALISAVNLAEVTARLAERCMPADAAHAYALALGPRVVAFDAESAQLVGALQPLTRGTGLSLGDRCCLALGQWLGAAVLTNERHRHRLAGAVGVEARDIRAGEQSGS